MQYPGHGPDQADSRMGQHDKAMDASHGHTRGLRVRTALLTVGLCSLSLGGFAIAQTSIVPNGATTVTTPYPGNLGTPAGQPAAAAALPSSLPQAPVAAVTASPTPQPQPQPQAVQAVPPVPTAQTNPLPGSTPPGQPPGHPLSQAVANNPGVPAAAMVPAMPSAGGLPAPADEANPFSSVRDSADTTALKTQLPGLEQRLRQVESRVSAIQQVQVALPPDALGQGGGGRISGGGAAVADDESVEMQTATFIACVNGRAMFRDSDQKPFFVDAKEAAQNDTVRRIGGCKH